MRITNKNIDTLRKRLFTRVGAVGVADLLRIPKNLSKAIAFVYIDYPDPANFNQRKKVPRGTAFFVGVPERNDNYHFIYVVTALHLVNGARYYGSPVYIRINLTDGTRMDVKIPCNEWVEPPLYRYCNCGVQSPRRGQLRYLPLSELATDEFIKTYQVTEGDELCFTGLFGKHPGKKEHLPIVRFGKISLMPTEKIWIARHPEDKQTVSPVHAYLVECLSIGGLSGSPAFIDFRGIRGVITQPPPPPPTAVLGLVHGHYDIQYNNEFDDDSIDRRNMVLNAGITVVIPS
jgi:hypothetical protein